MCGVNRGVTGGELTAKESVGLGDAALRGFGEKSWGKKRCPHIDPHFTSCSHLVHWHLGLCTAHHKPRNLIGALDLVFCTVLPPLLQQKQQKQESPRAASWAGEGWNPQRTRGEVESWKLIKAISLCCMPVFPTSCPHLFVPASSLPEVTTLRLSLAVCPGPISHISAIGLHTQGWAGAWGEQGISCLVREGPLTGCVCCRIPISWFLMGAVKLNFTYRQHSGSNKEPHAHGARSNSRAQWVLLPVKNPQDNPIINIHSLFFHLIFKLIPTEKVRHILPPSSTLSATSRAFSATSKRE